MKKFYFLLVACLVSLAASAANPVLYLRGDMTGGSWPALSQYQFTENNGVYTLNLDQLYGAFKISTNNWDNNYNYGTSTQVDLDTDYKLTNGGSSPNIKIAGGKTLSDVTLTFTLSTATLRITGQAKENDYSTVYLVGDFNGTWSLDITNYPLTSTNGTTWKGEYTLTASANYFKMKAGTLVYGTGVDSDINVTMGESYTASQTGNAYVLGKGTYQFTFELQKNADTGVLTVTGQGEDVPVGDKSSWWFDLKGLFNSWGDNGKQVKDGVDGIITWNEVSLYAPASGNDPAGAFQIKIYDGENDSWYGSASPIQLNTWTQLSTANGTMTVAGDAPGKKYNVKFDTNNYQIYIEDAVLPTTMYVMGQVNGQGWSPLNGYEMTQQSEGVFTVENMLLGNGGDGNGYFSFAVALGADSSDAAWDAMQRYGAASDSDYPVELDTAMPVKVGSTAFKAPGDVNYNMTLDLNAMTLTVTAVEQEEPDTYYLVTSATPDFAKTTVVELANDGDGMYSCTDAVLAEDYYNVFYFVIANAEEPAEMTKVYAGETATPADPTPGFPETNARAASTEMEFGAKLFDSFDEAIANAWYIQASPVNLYFNFEEDGVMLVLEKTEDTTTGVDSVVADDQAPAEYFNLQGVRVANPTAGQLVIRRQGTTVTKVLVK